MSFKDEIIADMQATISRLTGELVERSNFEFKLMERLSFLQQQLQKQEQQKEEQLKQEKQEKQAEQESNDRVNSILYKCIKNNKR